MKKVETKKLEFEKENSKSREAVLQNLKKDGTKTGVRIYNTKDLDASPLKIREKMAEKTANTLCRALKSTEETIFYHMYGQRGIGKMTLVKRTAKLLGRNLMTIDLKSIKDIYLNNRWYPI